MSCLEFFPALDAMLTACGIRNFQAYEVAPLGRLADGHGPPLEAPPAKLWPNIIPTLQILDELRDYLERPVLINNGYRDPAYNAAVDGSSNSLHMAFSACDVRARGIEPARIAGWLTAHELARQCGIGLYRTFTHFDTRGLLDPPRTAPARWSGTGVGRWW